MTDNDDQVPDPNPWAGLDADADADGEAFNFDELDEEGPEPASEVEHLQDEFAVAGDVPDAAPGESDVPLAVFPRPDADLFPADGEDAAVPSQPAAEQPEIISMLDPGGFESTLGNAAREADEFDDAQLARELGLTDAENNPADFGDSAIESPADDVSFNADMVSSGDASPFAETGLSDGFADKAFADQDESPNELVASIPLATASVTATQAVRKKKGGLGQLVGVVMGGVMALPVTYAILLWGFQKDPLKLARSVPDQMAFLVPQSLRQSVRPSRPAAARADAGDASGVPPSAAEEAMPAAVAADTVAADGSEPAATAAASDGENPDGEKMGDAVAAKRGDDEPKAALMDPFKGLDVPPELMEEFRAALAKLTTADDIQAALARLAASPEPVPMAQPEPPAPVVPVPVAAPQPALLDLTGLEEAVAEAAAALDALEAVPDLEDPARKRLMVDWYRRLAKLGEQLSLLETSAVDSGRPLERSPEAVDAMFDRIRGSDLAVEDLRTLGRMWLASQKRRADGTVLVATVESTRRQLGPYWSTRVTIAGPDPAGRSVAVISRMPPEVDIGDQIMIAGVVFDADTVWAADVRPLGIAPAVDAEMPAIGIPPTFDLEIERATPSKPPMVDEAASVPAPRPRAVVAPADGDDDGPSAVDPKASKDGDEPGSPEASADADADAGGSGS